MAPARVPTHAGRSVSFPYPTACAIADAQDALSWVTAAVIGAGTAFITSPTGPYAIAASGAAIGVASKAAEAGLFGMMDTSLNVWGIFWVRDESCGPVDPRDFVQRPVGIPAAPQPGARRRWPRTCRGRRCAAPRRIAVPATRRLPANGSAGPGRPALLVFRAADRCRSGLGRGDLHQRFLDLPRGGAYRRDPGCRRRRDDSHRTRPRGLSGRCPQRREQRAVGPVGEELRVRTALRARARISSSHRGRR